MLIFEQGIQQVKDKGFAARFIFLAPPAISDLEQRLRKRGSDDEDKIKERLKIAAKELEHAKLEGVHDITFINENLDTTYEALERYIFEPDGTDETIGDGKEEPAEAKTIEVEMTDDAPTGGEIADPGMEAAPEATVLETDETSK